MDKKTWKKDVHQMEDEVKQNIKKTKKTKVVLSVLKLLLLVGIVVAIPLYIIFYQRDFIQQFRSFEDVLAYLEHYRFESIFIYIGIQVLQIIISVIPGQAFQFAAGYLYGFLPGLVFSIVGAFLGTTISFYLAKILGKDAVHLFFGEARTNYFIERLNSKKAYVIVFLLYLIPGLPKDVVSYAAGVSDMNFKAFMAFSMMGRLFGMSGSLLIGAFYFKQHYIGMGIIAVIAVVAFVLCIIYRKKIDKFLDKFYDKVTS